MEQNEVSQYYTNSGQPELCEKLFSEAIQYIADKGYTIELHQKKALLNHLTEMIKRDGNNEQITVDDKSVFNEVSSDSLGAAKEIVYQLANIAEDEIYLLAIHFEVVKYN